MKRTTVLTVGLISMMIFSYLLFSASTVFASKCGQTETAIINCENNPSESPLLSILLITINILTAGVGLVAVGVIAYGAVQYASAAGASEKLTAAKKTMAGGS